MSEHQERPQSPERAKLYQFARLELEVTELLCELMEKEKVSRAELARRVGVKPPYVTRILRGQTNLTLKTLSDFFFALGRSVRIVDRPMSGSTSRLVVTEMLPSSSTGAGAGMTRPRRSAGAAFRKARG
jgi:AraC-like DNA-binding protein